MCLDWKGRVENVKIPPQQNTSSRPILSAHINLQSKFHSNLQTESNLNTHTNSGLTTKQSAQANPWFVPRCVQPGLVLTTGFIGRAC